MKKKPLSPARLTLIAVIIFALAAAILFTQPETARQPSQSAQQSGDASASTGVPASVKRDAVVMAESVTPREPTAAPAIVHQSSGKGNKSSRFQDKRDYVPQIATVARTRASERAEEDESVKPDRPDEAERWRRLTLVDENGQIPDGALLKAWEQAKRMPIESAAWPIENQSKGNLDSTSVENVAGIQPTGWTWLGPGNVGGRIRSIVIHPTTPQTMWVGSVSGGIWKTTDGGTTWNPQNDFMANLAVSCMVIDPTNPNVIYAGTGEGFGNTNAIQGVGVFKTTNGGTTWTQLASTAGQNWFFVNRLAISPANSQIILAATGSGIWRSTDAGATWTQTYNAGDMLDVVFNPADGTKAVASSTSVARYSTDGGVTWNNATGITGARIEVAYARSNPSIVYAGVNNNQGEVYRSTDGGQTYTLANTGNNYLGTQGWYDNCVWVDPTNANNVIVGGVDLWRSTDGGQNFTRISRWQSAPPFGTGATISAHADNHIIIESPQFNGTTNKTVFFGNDGGIFRADDFSTVAQRAGWTSLNSSIGITQFYGAAGNPTSGRIIGGTQDNGTVTYIGGVNTWVAPFGGDGGWAAADPTDPNYMYGEYTNLQIHRSTSGGDAFSSNYIFAGLTDAEQNKANFIAPFILDPNNPNTLLGGGDQLWRSTNAKAETPTWAAIKASVGSNISAIAVATGNSNIIWVGHNDGRVYYTTNGTSANPTWTQANEGTPNLPNRYCTRITIDPTNSSRVYVTFGGFNADNVWRTNNNGTNWTNISGNLPQAPVRTLAVWQQNPNFLYVGTEVGIFASADGGTTWSASNDGPTNCSVDELFWMSNTLVAATHGRGLFSIAIGANKLNQTITFGALGNKTFGDAPFTVNATASSNLPVTFSILSGPATINGNTVTITGAGTVTVRASQVGDANFNAALNVDQAFTVAKATPVITWANPANIVAGTPLSATQLNATASVPGTFSYTPAAGIELAVGTTQLSVTFTPTDTTNYTTAQKSVQLTVVAGNQPTVFFSSATYTVSEGAGSISITVNRSDTSGTATVDYATSDTAGLQNCSVTNGIASSRCDYATTVGTLQFAANDASKTIFIPIVDDSYAEGNETFTIKLSNPSGATLGTISTATITITDNDATTGGNPVVGVPFFVRQQYIDFLGREPDPGGFQGWQDILNNCPQSGKDAQGNFCDRIAVSSGFFRSPEFQDRGYFVFRFYPVALGRNPSYAEFIPDLAKVSGFLTDAQLEANKVAFVNEFITRTEFTNKYASLSDAAFRAAIVQTAGIDPGIAFPNGTMTRAQFLRAFVESTSVSQKFFNQAFVVMQYFGYLRRDPDALYLNWIQIMNQNGGDYRAMINGFMNSTEYFLRFGP